MYFKTVVGRPYFISKKVFGFVFRKKICGTQKTGFSPKNRKNRFFGLLKANLARKMVFSDFWLKINVFDIILGILKIHWIFSSKKFFGVKKVIF